MNPVGGQDKAGGVDPADINIDIEPASETPAKMIDNSPTTVKDEMPEKKDATEVNDVYGRPVTAV